MRGFAHKQRTFTQRHNTFRRSCAAKGRERFTGIEIGAAAIKTYLCTRNAQHTPEHPIYTQAYANIIA